MLQNCQNISLNGQAFIFWKLKLTLNMGQLHQLTCKFNRWLNWFTASFPACDHVKNYFNLGKSGNWSVDWAVMLVCAIGHKAIDGVQFISKTEPRRKSCLAKVTDTYLGDPVSTIQSGYYLAINLSSSCQCCVCSKRVNLHCLECS